MNRFVYGVVCATFCFIQSGSAASRAARSANHANNFVMGLIAQSKTVSKRSSKKKRFAGYCSLVAQFIDVESLAEFTTNKNNWNKSSRVDQDAFLPLLASEIATLFQKNLEPRLSYNFKITRTRLMAGKNKYDLHMKVSPPNSNKTSKLRFTVSINESRNKTYLMLANIIIQNVDVSKKLRAQYYTNFLNKFIPRLGGRPSLADLVDDIKAKRKGQETCAG